MATCSYDTPAVIAYLLAVLFVLKFYVRLMIYSRIDATYYSMHDHMESDRTFDRKLN